MPNIASNAVIVGLLALILVTACSKGVHGGDPALPLSDANGTVRIFQATEKAVNMAMSNAFGETKYRGMSLDPPQDHIGLIPNWKPTNGFILFPLLGPITNVPLKGSPNTVVQYAPVFHIVVESIDAGHTKVFVRTVLAQVFDGQEIGVHGGYAKKSRVVQPVRSEEENILKEIAQSVGEAK